MPQNYRMEYALKAREAIDAMGISAVVALLRKRVGKHSSSEMTEAEIIEATAILESEIIRVLKRRSIQPNEWRQRRLEDEARANWNAEVDQRKADRQRRRNEKKVSG